MTGHRAKEGHLMNRDDVIKWSGLAFLVAAVVSLGACGSFSVGSVIRVPVPERIAAAQGIKETPTLDEVRERMPEWASDAQRDFDELARNVERAAQWEGFVNDLLMQGANAAGPMLMGLPFGSVLSAAILGAAGIATGRVSGTQRLRVEKEDSYNAGIEIGVEKATRVLQAAGFTVTAEGNSNDSASNGEPVNADAGV